MIVDVTESKMDRELLNSLNNIDNIIENSLEEFDIRCKISRYAKLYESSVIFNEANKSFDEWMNGLVVSVINGFRSSYEKLVNKVNNIRAKQLKEIEDKKRQAAINKASDNIIKDGKRSLDKGEADLKKASKSDDKEYFKEQIHNVTNEFKDSMNNLAKETRNIANIEKE